MEGSIADIPSLRYRPHDSHYPRAAASAPRSAARVQKLHVEVRNLLSPPGSLLPTRMDSPVQPDRRLAVMR